MLIAPAGYGKTTLAREWLGAADRRWAWYRGGPAAADVAALAAGLAEAASKIIPGAGRRMRDRLQATGHAEEDVEILGELLGEDVQEWPVNAWLAIDDYQFAMDSPASERFVDLLTQNTPIQLLITSRRRPTWATARRILYGEVFEIDRRVLAMDGAEAREVLGRGDADIAPIIEGAHGWPAVIGLIAHDSDLAVGKDRLPDQLYDYFAQELYAALPSAYRIPLAELAFCTGFDRAFAASLLGAIAERTIEAGVSGGVLAEPERNSFEIHPLLSKLMQEQAFPDQEDHRRAADRVGRALLQVDRWDDAADLAGRFRLPDLLIASVERSLEPLIDFGRVATVSRWLETASALHCESPVLDVAEAEVAFRQGDHRKAEALAFRAADRLKDHPLSSRAYVRAGHGALLASREAESIRHFRLAQESARTPRERREALYGLYSAMSELEMPEAGSILEELQTLEAETPDDLLRSLAIKLIQSVRVGAIEQTLAQVEHQADALDRATNPLITTSFLHSLSNALSLAAQYERSLQVAEQLHQMIARHRLDFARPFAYIDRAVAYAGRRNFARALRDLESAHRALPPSGDVHIEGNLTALRCRILTAMGRASQAVDDAQLASAGMATTAPLRAEILISRAAALASTSQHAAALAAVNEAESASATSLMVRVLGPGVRAICDVRPLVREAEILNVWKAATETGNLDSFVAAYRSYPPLLAWVADVADVVTLSDLIGRANDVDIAKRFGIPAYAGKPQRAPLTPRETEVMNLVAAGLSNKEVARTLVVAEATIKVHLRHVYEKLGVRGRTEAVAKWLAPR